MREIFRLILTCALIHQSVYAQYSPPLLQEQAPFCPTNGIPQGAPHAKTNNNDVDFARFTSSALDNSIDFQSMITNLMKAQAMIQETASHVTSTIDGFQNPQDFSEAISKQGPDHSRNPLWLIFHVEELANKFNTQLAQLITKAASFSEFHDMTRSPLLWSYIMTRKDHILELIFNQQLNDTLTATEGFSEINILNEYPELWTHVQENRNLKGVLDQKLTDLINNSTDLSEPNETLCSYIMSKSTPESKTAINHLIQRIDSLDALVNFTKTSFRTMVILDSELGLRYENSIFQIIAACTTFDCWNTLVLNEILISTIGQSAALRGGLLRKFLFLKEDNKISNVNKITALHYAAKHLWLKEAIESAQHRRYPFYLMLGSLTCMYLILLMWNKN